MTTVYVCEGVRTPIGREGVALRSQQRAAAAQKAGIFAEEIAAVDVPDLKGSTKKFSEDEHGRPQTTLEAFPNLPAPFRKDGTVTAGNASGINDGACVSYSLPAANSGAATAITPLLHCPLEWDKA